MKKTLLLLCALLSLCGGAWADVTVTLSDQTDLGSITDKAQSEAETVHKYGTYASGAGGTTFTTNSTSGLEGLVISTTGDFIKPTYYVSTSYLHCLAITPTAGDETTYTVTITAPSGYYIKSYSMTAISTSSKGEFNVTPLGGTTKTVSSSQQRIDVTACANTASFTVKRNTGSTNDTELCLPFFTVTLASTSLSGSYSLQLNSTTGTATRSDGNAPTGGADFSTYTSTASPAGLTLVSSGNSMNWTLTTMKLHSYGGTYTLTAPSGYFIKGYTMSTYVSAGKINTIKPAAATTTTRISESSSDPTIICVDDIHATSTTFTRASSNDSNKDYATTTFTVYLEPTINITYQVTLGGNVVASTVIPQYAGSSSLATPPSSLQNNFVNCSGPDIATVSAENHVVTYTGTLKDGFPFTYSTDYDDATWYYWKLNGSYISYDLSTPYPASTTKPTTDAGLWAFIGSPYGTKIINKAAGETRYLQANSWAEMTTTETEWVIANNTAKGSLAYFTVHTGANKYLNLQSTSLRYWDDARGATDNGSTFIVEEHSDEYAADVATYITPYFSNHGSYFALNETAYSANSATWSAATVTCDKTTYDALLAVVSNTSNLVWPETGYYLLKNNNSGTYLSTTTTPALSATTTTPATIIKLTKNNDDTYYIQSQGEYLTFSGTSVVRGETPVKFFVTLGTATKVSLTLENGSTSGYGNISSHGGDLCGYPARGITTDPWSYWIVEDAPTSLDIPLTAANDNTGTGHTYATLCVPFNITGLTGYESKEVKAYAPTRSGDYIVSGEGASTVIAGTPVILIGAAGATSVTAAIGSNYATSPATTNVLTGTFTGTNIDTRAATGTNYVLGFDENNSNRIGFYHVNNSSFALKANRAYLHVSSGGSVKGFVFNFDELFDGIGSLTSDPSTVGEGSIYNLAGQRINKLQRGVNIVNGKKVIVK